MAHTAGVVDALAILAQLCLFRRVHAKQSYACSFHLCRRDAGSQVMSARTCSVSPSTALAMPVMVVARAG